MSLALRPGSYSSPSLIPLWPLEHRKIAATLFLSEGTVRNYASGIFTKLGVMDRTQAAVIALRHGLVD
jgi:DNA-binding NarL/FixJ family response regulator